MADDGKLVLNGTPTFTGAARAPLVVVEHLLSMMIGVLDEQYAEAQSGGPLTNLKRTPAYQNAVAASAELQVVDLSALRSHEDMLTFFLNLYNLMVLQGAVWCGVPKSLVQRLTFFRTMVFSVGQLGMISAIEVEHAILRGHLNKPSLIGSRMLPKFATGDPRSVYIVRNKEPMINFAMCCGAFSSPRCVIFYSSRVREQLQSCTRRYMHEHTEVDRKKRKVILPKTLDWYKKDIAATNHELLAWVKPFLADTDLAQIEAMDAENQKITVKFAEYNWDMFYYKDSSRQSESYAEENPPPLPNLSIRRASNPFRGAIDPTTANIADYLPAGFTLLPGDHLTASAPTVEYLPKQEGATHTGILTTTRHLLLFWTNSAGSAKAKPTGTFGSNSEREMFSIAPTTNKRNSVSSAAALGAGGGGGVAVTDQLQTALQPVLVSVPLGFVEKVICESRAGVEMEGTYGMHVYLKDGRCLVFAFPRGHNERRRAVARGIESYAFPGLQSDLFAFRNKEAVTQDGWNVYDIKREWDRLGVPNEDWRFTDLNASYRLCSTYPPYLVVPRSTPDSLIKACAEFRTKERIPVLCWLHPATGSTISRSSQPRTGLQGKRCDEDEALIAAIVRHSHVQGGTLSVSILDARPRANAVANTAMGAGYERTDHYGGLVESVSFLGIGNIHVMRDSLNRLRALCEGDAEIDDAQWLSALESTRWLDHVALVIAGAQTAVKMVAGSASVLVHCSDGWDRTSQIVALAQLMLDPYYRTLRGFMVLVEKEWLAFGHKFASRSGHADGNFEDEQRSPIFLQFIECVWQLTVQAPCAFEFNEDFLIATIDAVYSCRFGTFLYNSMRERVQTLLDHRTISFWGYVLANEAQYVNPLFTATPGFLEGISHSVRSLSFWNRYYFRYHTKFVPTRTHGSIANELARLKKELAELRAQSGGGVPSDGAKPATVTPIASAAAKNADPEYRRSKSQTIVTPGLLSVQSPPTSRVRLKHISFSEPRKDDPGPQRALPALPTDGPTLMMPIAASAPAGPAPILSASAPTSAPIDSEPNSPDITGESELSLSDNEEDAEVADDGLIDEKLEILEAPAPKAPPRPPPIAQTLAAAAAADDGDDEPPEIPARSRTLPVATPAVAPQAQTPQAAPTMPVMRSTTYNNPFRDWP